MAQDQTPRGIRVPLTTRCQGGTNNVEASQHVVEVLMHVLLFHEAMIPNNGQLRDRRVGKGLTKGIVEDVLGVVRNRTVRGAEERAP